MEQFRIHPLMADRRNVELLAALQEQPRASIAELARAIGTSAPTARERLARLEEAGILRPSCELNPAALGWPLMAFVRVRPIPGHLQKVAELAHAMPEVAECHRITGEDCFILRVHLRSVATLDAVLDRFLAHGQTTTSLVQSTPVPQRSAPLPQWAKPPKRRSAL